MTLTQDILIVGGGHAGAQLAISLRQTGFAGTITIVNRENSLPYERPPLSKEYLAKERSFERMHIRPAKYWQDKEIHVATGCEVVSVDPQAKVAKLSDGRELSYGKLVWACGGDPRKLACEGADLRGIHAIRTAHDIDAIDVALGDTAKRIGIVGGGYTGLEAAASLRKLGHKVVLLEALPRVLARVAGEQISNFYAQEHIRHRVDLRLDCGVHSFEGVEGHVTHICLADGERLACDLAIIGIGIVPEIGALVDAGAEHGNGVKIDRFCRTSLPDIYAIGDCAEHSNPYADGAAIRLESVQNAHDMAATVAKHIRGIDEPYNALPWFWSNQYDLKLQTAGLSIGHDEAVLRGNPSDFKFSVVYLKKSVVIAIDCVNCAKDFVQGRRIIEARLSARGQDLADASRPLKDFLPQG
jgi:3-phenylpropionate/trans-cinnamate dioxygenase ferredoxin reductase component